MSKDAKVVLTIVGGFVGLAAVGFILAVFVAAFSTTTSIPNIEPTPTITTPEPVKTNPEDDKYEEVLPGAKTVFVDECVKAGSSEAGCGCMYDWLDSHYTNKEFKRFTEEADNGEIPEEIYGAVSACIDVEAANQI